MVLKASDFDSASSANNGGAEGGSDDGSAGAKYDDLKAVCGAIGANYESAREYVDENGKKEGILGTARELDENPELAAVYEEYRRFAHMKAILQNFGYNYDDHEFNVWAGQFWGDTDDPEPDTFNHAQQAVRELEGNLPWYDALFPVPQEEYWDGQAVAFTMKGDWQIYVPEWWMEDYADFAKEVNGEMLPMPPSDAEIEAMQSGDSVSESNNSGSVKDDAPFAIHTYTANDAQKKVREGWSLDELKALRKLEIAESGYEGGRDTVVGLIDKKMEKARDSEDEQATLEDASESDDDDVDRKVKIVMQHDVKPSTVDDMRERGKSWDEIESFLA